ncbi:MAG: 16S rRNA (cytosine(1402)-N(4))-methyltransferase RsmH [Gemmatimonadota bacterium]
MTGRGDAEIPQGFPEPGSVAGGDSFHRPVLVNEVLAHLEPAQRGKIMDGTAGGGGHSLALLERYRACRIVAVDRDPIALEATRMALKDFEDRVRFVEARFDEAAVSAGLVGPTLMGALLDLGLSTHQLDSDERGFSFRPQALLDMRMAGDARGEASAADLLNDLDEGELARVFREYGEEPRPRRLSRAVVERRRSRPFRVASDLLAAMEAAYGRSPGIKAKARVWQALRVAVNDEIDALEAALPALREALLPGGILSVIAYESLTDRIVKHTFQEWSRACICPPALPTCVCRGEALGKPVVKGIVRPSAGEVTENPRARSARLRSWRKAA